MGTQEVALRIDECWNKAVSIALISGRDKNDVCV